MHACIMYVRMCGIYCIVLYSSTYIAPLNSQRQTEALLVRLAPSLQVRRMKTRFCDHAFSAAGPRCWNRLPAALRTVGSIDSFKTGLKTYLFSISSPGC